jgi:hypothetical protein
LGKFAAVPHLSIITVTYQAAKVLPITLQSVAAQTWKAWEHIFVDGGSRDGTLAQIEAYAQTQEGVWYLSEPDRGLYDAMNKGLAMARGEYVCFLNAGDSFWAADTLERLFTGAPPEADVLYGEHVEVDETGQILPTPRHRPYPEGALSMSHFRTGMRICHQALIVRRRLAPSYDLRYPLAADLDWSIRLLRQKPHTYDSGQVLIRYLAGGISARRLRRYVWERTAILYRHFGVGAVLESGWAIVRHKVLGGYPRKLAP